MGVLAVEVDDRVTVGVVGDRRGSARARRDVDLTLPDAVWRGVLAAGVEVRDAAPGGVAGLVAATVADRTTTVVLWDVETLGSPLPALCSPGGTFAERLTRVREREPRTWGLLLEGQYAVGTYESYLVARLSRGTYHVTDLAHAARTGLLDPATGDWSTTRCAALGVPRDALPEIVTGAALARTEPGAFLGLDLPVLSSA